MSHLNVRAGQHYPKLGNIFLLGDHREAFLPCNFPLFFSATQLNTCAYRNTGSKLREIPFVCLFVCLFPIQAQINVYMLKESDVVKYTFRKTQNYSLKFSPH